MRAIVAVLTELGGMFVADRVLTALALVAVTLAAGLSWGLHLPGAGGLVLLVGSLAALTYAVLTEARRRAAPVGTGRTPTALTDSSPTPPGPAMTDVAPALARSASGFDLTPPTADQRARLEAGLTREEREVLLKHGTEAPFCGLLLENKQAGAYCCRLCGLPLFRSGQKFESGTGWPSFTSPYDEAHTVQKRDVSYGMVRTETVCARCGSHQGHVFPDGPPPTGLRYCINSVALSFTPADVPFPDPLGRGEAHAGNAATAS